MDFLAMLKEAGFKDAESGPETGHHSSPVTVGMLFKATKPDASSFVMEDRYMSTMDHFQQFMASAYSEGVLDLKTRYLIALGASLGAGCDP